MLPFILVSLVIVLMLTRGLAGPARSQVSYSDFVAKVGAGQIQTVDINDKGAVDGTLKDGKSFTTQIPTALGSTNLEQQLQAQHVKITATRSDTSIWPSLLVAFLPLLLLIGFFLWSVRRTAGSLTGGISAIGRSRAKIIEAERPTTGFADVAGYDGVKQEISEVVDFLRHPERYARAGAKGPRGVIMVGPPGTGKTLFARAVAGEADVPFLSMTGSAFVEMFVGVGASRVRDLFDEARKRAPSIIFIDEIDAVGGRRGGGTRLGGNDEREQTLNQLLAEMDGFDQGTGIVVLAATNRPDALDPALLRPGRFDRQVTVPLPNQAERAAILTVHARGKTLAPEVDLDVVARATPGFSGADLANLVNEAAINAVRADRSVIQAQDLDAARDRVLLGRRESSNALLPEERHSVAVHESGHALVAALCEHADPVAKVTILPSGVTLGVTEQLPEAERHLYSEAYLTDLLAVRLAEPVGGTGGLRRGLDGRGQRPGRGHPDRDPHGPRVRALSDPGPGRLRLLLTAVPRRAHPGGPAPAALLGADAAHRRRGSRPAPAAGRGASPRPAPRPPRRPRPARGPAGHPGDRRRRRRAGGAPQHGPRPPRGRRPLTAVDGDQRPPGKGPVAAEPGGPGRS
ncbi:hypothetical protein GCM10020000_70330 [Streptomyces olivoverticillatus]